MNINTHKKSGIDWIGEVPIGWDIKRLKYIFRIRKDIVGELGHKVLSITNKGVKVKDIDSGEGQISSDYSKYQKVKIGDFAIMCCPSLVEIKISSRVQFIGEGAFWKIPIPDES